MLGGILEVQQSLRDCLDEQENMVCTNSLDEGFVTLYRVYPPGVDAAAQYKRELNYPDYREQLIRHNRFQEETADLMWEWFRQRKELDGGFTPYTSYSSGFRPTTYNREQADPHAVIYALKSFPMNININRETMDVLVKTTQEAARQVWKKWQEEDPEK
ncbi:MAG: hypothetical protein GY757_04935 [bacterium]|nr:hypothetical protein [bacterium]